MSGARTKLTVNARLIDDFMAAPTPCCELGLIEEHSRNCAFLALRPNQPIPAEVCAGGFSFGHALLGTAEFEVVIGVNYSFQYR